MTTIKGIFLNKGFSIFNTGGRCLALHNIYDDMGRYVLVTDNNGLSIPIDENNILIGLYNAAGNEIAHKQGNINEVIYFYEKSSGELLSQVNEEGQQHDLFKGEL